MKGKLLLLSVFFTSCPILAQRHEILSPDIRSLQVVANGDWLSLPVAELGNGSISIDFDDTTHEYRRYTYRIEHCEADWTTSTGLFDSDIVSGFINDNTIDDYQQSLLTNTLYTHYHITLPNEKCRPKLSGNYRLTVLDTDEQPVLSACFMLTEPQGMGVGLSVTTQTDATINTAHQQVGMELSYGNYTVTDPNRQIKTVVLQNRRWDDARWNSRPQYVMGDGLRWSHNKDYIFMAGNEYRKFEILSTDFATMGIERIGWDGSNFQAYPFTALPRPNYLYDEDADGAFVVRNSNDVEVNTQSDYMTVHFQYACPRLTAGEIYLNGDWTYDRFEPQYRMEYNEDAKSYEAAIPLKLGYYNYQFLLLDANGRTSFLPSEGSFYQTENTYQALVYYRETGGRTDRLVGYRSIKK
ncbi:type IX secretion system plug protein [Prevotella dentasini]|uniref:type IX secretion system plug protein n=1 Tax=Prevotella dentasini TaxID=589537 RepID=UPI000469B576|nr:DUF5103 domain-containing protein [Prevotella dentasini]